MFFFDHILNPPKTGRHTEAGVVDRLTRELAEVRASRDNEVRGYQQALQQAGRDVQEARSRSDFHMRGWQAADREVKRLRAILDQDAGMPGTMPQPAFVDRPGFEPLPDAPTPEREQEQLPPIALTLPRPVECEAADVTAETQAVPQIGCDETQAVDVAALRDAIGEGDTAVIPIVPVTPQPVVDLPKLTWGVQPKQREALAAWALGTAPPAGAGATEVSAITGRLASFKVTTALEPVSEAS